MGIERFTFSTNKLYVVWFIWAIFTFDGNDNVCANFVEWQTVCKGVEQLEFWNFCFHCGNSIDLFYGKSSLLRLELKLMDRKLRTKVFDDIHGGDGDFVINEIINDFQRLTFGFTNRMPFEFVSIPRTFTTDDGGEDWTILFEGWLCFHCGNIISPKW